MADLLIDSTFLLIIVFLPAMVMLFAGFFVGRLATPKMARELGTAMKKAQTVVFLATPSKHLNIIRTDAGISGALRHKDLDIIPDPRGVLNCYGAQVVVASTENASNVTPEFVEVTEELMKLQKKGGLKNLTEATGVKAGTTPEDLGRLINAVYQKKEKLQDRVKWYGKVKSHEVTVQELANEIGLEPESSEYKEFRDDIEKDLLDNGAKVKQELEKMDKASFVTSEQDGFSIKTETDPSTKKKTYKLIRTVQIPLDRFHYLIPTGSNMNALWTLIRRRIEQDKYEKGFNESTGFKWLIIGIVVFMVMMGAGVFLYLGIGK